MRFNADGSAEWSVEDQDGFLRFKCRSLGLRLAKSKMQEPGPNAEKFCYFDLRRGKDLVICCERGNMSMFVDGMCAQRDGYVMSFSSWPKYRRLWERHLRSTKKGD